jgi:hypothetical protein
LPQPLDLIDAFHLLLCVLDLLVVHLPDQLRVWSLTDNFGGGSGGDNSSTTITVTIPAAVGSATTSATTRSAVAAQQQHHQQHHHSAANASAIDTLVRLCQSQGANLSEVRKTRQNLLNPLVVTLRDSRILTRQPARLPSLVALSANLYLGGLLEHHLAANHRAMAHEYDILLASTPDITLDERLFVDEPDQIGSPKYVGKRRCTGTRNTCTHNHQSPPFEPEIAN